MLYKFVCEYVCVCVCVCVGVCLWMCVHIAVINLPKRSIVLGGDISDYQIGSQQNGTASTQHSKGEGTQDEIVST